MKMTLFEKLLVVLITICILFGIFGLGYQIGKDTKHKNYELHNKIIAAQRDRLADYIRIYEDMQDDNFDAADSISLRDFINEIEHEDNIDCMTNGMPPMNIDDWGYCY